MSWLQQSHVILRYGVAEGGGLMLAGYDAPVEVDANLFDSNYGNDHGGAIAMHDSTNVSIVNNVFRRNHVRGQYGLGGGAIHSMNFDPVIVNNTFVENWVGLTSTWPPNAGDLKAYGGAVHVRSYLADPVAVQLVNNIFYDNRALDGKSVSCTQNGLAAVSYCDAYPEDPGTPPDNERYHYYAEPPTQQYLYTSITVDDESCVYANPSFCNGAFWLQADSPVRGIGQNPAQNSPVPPIDKDGRPRPGVDGYTDMGAYEDNPAWPP